MKPQLGNLIALGVGEAATRGFSFLAFSYLGHVLTPADFGIYGSAMAVMMFGMLALDQGFGIHGSRGIARAPEETELLVSRIVSSQVWLAIAVYSIFWLVTLAFSFDETLKTLIRGLGLSLFAAPFLLQWVFQGRNEMVWSAIPTAMRQAVFLALVYLLVKSADDLEKLVVAELGAVALAAIVFFLVYKRARLKLRLSVEAGFNKELFREAIPIGLSNLIWAFRTYLPILIVLSVLGKYDAGLFEAGHRIVMVFIGILGVYFTNLFPAMSAAARHEFSTIKTLVRQALGLGVGGCILAAIFIGLSAEWLISFIIGPDYATATAVKSMATLSWILPILALRRLANIGLIAMDRQASELRCSVIGLVVLVAIVIPMTSAFGLLGTVAALLISEVLATFIMWAAFRRVTSERAAIILRAGQNPIE